MNIKINENTQNSLIILAKTINDSQVQIQNIAISYLDALNADPSNYEV